MTTASHQEVVHPFKITSRYDPAKDITTTVLSPGKQDVTDGGDDKLYVIASFAYKGETPVRPRSVFLGFGSLFALNNLDRTEITVILEGTRQMDFKGRVVNTDSKGKPLSLVGTYVPSDEFIQLAQAAGVEVRLQNIRSTFSAEQLAGLRDLASRIPPGETNGDIPAQL